MDFKHIPKRVGYKINIPRCSLVIAIAVVIAIVAGIVIISASVLDGCFNIKAKCKK